MNLVQAEKVVNDYGAALASGNEGEFARKISSLPANKDTIIKAYKLFIAHYIEYDILTEEIGNQLVLALCGINIFVTDSEAQTINSSASLRKVGVPADDPRIRNSVQFMMKNGYDGVLFDEINEFIGQVQDLNKEDPLYHQRIYTLAGVEYIPEESSIQIEQPVQNKIISKVIMNFLKRIVIGAVIIIVIAFFNKGNFIVVNENSYLGMDKDGRQILIQSLNQANDEPYTIESEFNDTNFFQRLVFGEPMRTTFRVTHVVLDYNLVEEVNEETFKKGLAEPASDFLDLFRNGGTIHLTDSDTIERDVLADRAKRYGVKTFEDLLTAFGFKMYEVYVNRDLVASITLNNQGNTVHKGGLFGVTRLGYTPPKMIEDRDYLDKNGVLPADYPHSKK